MQQKRLVKEDCKGRLVSAAVAVFWAEEFGLGNQEPLRALGKDGGEDIVLREIYTNL